MPDSAFLLKVAQRSLQIAIGLEVRALLCLQIAEQLGAPRGVLDGIKERDAVEDQEQLLERIGIHTSRERVVEAAEQRWRNLVCRTRHPYPPAASANFRKSLWRHPPQEHPLTEVRMTGCNFICVGDFNAFHAVATQDLIRRIV